jgi:N-acetylglucosaminyl-diphospho-decaprenol L-rhamnosyltransferase
MSSATPRRAAMPVRAVVVMVTFRSAGNLPDVLPALDGWLRDAPDGGVVVIENDGDATTTDLVRTTLAAHADRVLTIVAAANAGFAPAVNAAREAATAAWGDPDVVLLLNPDVVTDPATLAAAIARVGTPGVGVVAPMLLDDDGHLDRGSARRFWNLRRLFAEVVGSPALARLLGTPRRTIDLDGRTGLVDVDITSGAFLAVRTEILGAGVDTRLPMYLEDQEICHRAARAGWRVVVDTDLRARHVGGVSRRSDGARARELRMMELATAPALSLLDVAAPPVGGVRAVVGGAGIVRTGIAALLLLPSLPFPRRREWALEQLRLGSWFVGWAADGRALEPVSWSAA